MVRQMLRLLPVLLWDCSNDLITDQISLLLGKQKLGDRSIISCSLASFLPIFAHAIIELLLDNIESCPSLRASVGWIVSMTSFMCSCVTFAFPSLEFGYSSASQGST